jgi:predicted dehydrogenase
VSLRLGFVGVGWIGRNRLEAVVADGSGTVAAVADASAEAAEAVAGEHGAPVVEVDALLSGGVDVDGVVIATPSGLHAAQAAAALEAGLPVFCQKPLGRTAAECRTVVDAARRADRLLGVDLSYRFVAAAVAVRDQLAAAAIGPVFATELVFHNAYGPGPEKAWSADPALAGGGCVIDLGIHLVDLALWALGDGAKVEGVRARLFAGGRPLGPDPTEVEDHAVALLELADGGVVDLACSWHHSGGRDADIRVAFHGPEGTLEVANVDGSFYDFRGLLHRGTSTTVLVEPPDAWGGRAAVAWARRVAAGGRFDPANEELVAVAEVLDRVYGR